MDIKTATEISREFKGYPLLAIKMTSGKVAARLGKPADSPAVILETRATIARVLAPHHTFARKILAQIEGK